MKFFTNKYNQSEIWKNALQVREEKKQTLASTVISQEQFVKINAAYPNQPQVIFTQADRGHNQEEANKIQQLYRDLRDVTVSPKLAI